jgi:alcohol dehydrogenase
VTYRPGTPAPPAFDLAPQGRLIYGDGSLDRLGEIVRALPAHDVLLVTDPGLVAAGLAARAASVLEAAGLSVRTFDGVHEDPTTADVEACLAVARAGPLDALVGFGGGSSIDTAKGAGFLLAGGGRIPDYRGWGKARGSILPIVAVPTTAGTGSECQSFALIAEADTHRKMACGDTSAMPRAAILDPLLTLSQPRRVTAATGLDALTHAVECAVTRARTPLSSMYAREAFRLLEPNLCRVLAGPDDREARGAMLLGAAFAGIAIENSMLGAAHALANPLSMRYATPHGQAVGTMLPWVVRFNAALPEAAAEYAALARAAGLPPDAGALARRLEELVATAGFPASLAAAGVPDSDVPELAREAADQWTGRFNPRPAAEKDFAHLYRQALGASGPVGR